MKKQDRRLTSRVDNPYIRTQVRIGERFPEPAWAFACGGIKWGFACGGGQACLQGIAFKAIQWVFLHTRGFVEDREQYVIVQRVANPTVF